MNWISEILALEGKTYRLKPVELTKLNQGANFYQGNLARRK